LDNSEIKDGAMVEISSSLACQFAISATEPEMIFAPTYLAMTGL